MTAGELLDDTRRIAVISAFEPEWEVLRAILHDRSDHIVNVTAFLTGTISGKPVVVFQSGIGMVNAAMTTQLALERFRVESIVFSGIGGGVNPDLSLGDVVVPKEWSSLQVVLAREGGDGYVLPKFFDRAAENFGMMFPQSTQIAQIGRQPEKRLWFTADAHLLDIAKAVSGKIALKDCTTDHKCLERHPKVLVGGAWRLGAGLCRQQHVSRLHPTCIQCRRSGYGERGRRPRGLCQSCAIHRIPQPVRFGRRRSRRKSNAHVRTARVSEFGVSPGGLSFGAALKPNV